MATVIDAAESLSLPAGTRFGRYRVERTIGAGGMGAVYEATHVELKKRVALKTLLPAVARNPEVLARFLREGEATSRIRHPHVVDVTDVGTHDGVPFLVMAYLDGEDLGKRLAREPRLTVADAIDVVLPVLSGVATAHAAGIVHRDLKPENILLTRGAHGGVHPVVLDFGISKLADDTSDLALTGTQAVLGTACYMSPEQARGAKHVDARSDQYALGAVLYRCTTGRVPCDGDSLYDVLHKIVEGRFARPRDLAPELPEGFEQVVLTAMQTDPARRHATLTALGRALGCISLLVALFASGPRVASPSRPSRAMAVTDAPLPVTPLGAPHVAAGHDVAPVVAAAPPEGPIEPTRVTPRAAHRAPLRHRVGATIATPPRAPTPPASPRIVPANGALILH